MVQEMIVAVIGIAVVFYIIRKIVRLMRGKSSAANSCCGCSGCKIKDCASRQHDSGCSGKKD